MSAIVFKDITLKIPVEGHILYEGESYYIKLEGIPPALVERWVADKSMADVIQFYLPQNLVHLRFDTLVGFVNILDTRYEVRSWKLGDDSTGNGQFQTLLDDITKMARSLTFRFITPMSGRREATKNYDYNAIRMLDYYYQLAFEYPATRNLEALLNQCLKYPHVRYESYTETRSLDRANKMAPGFARQLGRKGDFTALSPSHPLSNTQLFKDINTRFGRPLFPARVDTQHQRVTYDTAENRFILFFLEEIRNCCRQILHTKNPLAIKAKAQELDVKVAPWLQIPIFREIGQLNYMPASSSVLLKKAGYRELYYHHVQSKRSAIPILEQLQHTAHNSKLKDIALLYEIWVFYKIASLLFRDQPIRVSVLNSTLKQGMVIDSYGWSAGNLRLFYNKSYTRGTQGSYSLTLRPDITLELEDGRIFCFDAKYKFKETPTGEEGEETAAEPAAEAAEEMPALQRIVKREDLHKMHAYLDAIPNAVAAIAIYPGNTLEFYDRSFVKHDSPFSLLDVRGVGALPLLPRRPEMDQVLAAVLGPLAAR